MFNSDHGFMNNGHVEFRSCYSATSIVPSSAASIVPSSVGLAMVEPSDLALVLPSIAASSRENKRKRGKEVARTTEDSPTKNTTTKVMKKAKIKKRLVADL